MHVLSLECHIGGLCKVKRNVALVRQSCKGMGNCSAREGVRACELDFDR